MRALLVVVLLLLGLAVLADRVGVGIAEDKVAEQVAAKGGLAGHAGRSTSPASRSSPRRWPARYDDVRIALTAEELGQPAGTRADIALHGVHVPLSSVVSGSVDQVPVDRIDGTATLSYALLAAQLGGDTTLRREGDGLRITKTVEVLGRTIPLTATGTVALDGDELVVDVEQASGAGVDLPDFLVDPGQRPARPALRRPGAAVRAAADRGGARPRTAWTCGSRRRTPFSAAESRRREYPTGSVGLLRGMSGIGAAVVAVALVVTAVAAWWLRTRNGAVKATGDAGAAGRGVRPPGRPAGRGRPDRRPVLHRLLRPVPLHQGPPPAVADHPARAWPWSTSTPRATSTRCANSTSAGRRRCSTSGATGSCSAAAAGPLGRTN